MRRWHFAWAWLIGAVLAVSLPSCGGITLPDSDGDGIPDIIDPCPQDPDPSCVPGPPPAEPYDCTNPPAIAGLVKVAHPIADHYIVVLKPTRAIVGPAAVREFAAKFKGVEDVEPLVRAFAAKIAKASVAAVAADPAIQYVQQEGTKSIPKPKTGSAAAALSWGLDRVDQRLLPLDKSFAPDGDGAGVHVYINDTGVTKTDDLGDRLSDDCFSTIVFQGCNDGHGHGTHVAGTAAGNTWGVAKKATVHSVRFLDANGSGTDSDAIRTLDWIAQHPGGGVVNASWGGDPAPAVDAAVCRVIESGKVFVAAAGNESADAYSSTPARVVQVVTVGATDDGDGQAYFSNFGPALDLYAPGVNIESDTPTGGTAVYSGTSMATPHVVGGVALLAGKYPADSPAQLRDRLVSAATKDVLLGLGAGSPNLLLYTGRATPPPPACPEECPPGTACTDPAQGCVPVPPQCPEQCPPGQHCTDPRVGCVPDTPTISCPKTIAPGAYVYMRHKAYGQGWDSTLRVHGDPEFCRIVHGESINDCHLEGWPERAACEMELNGATIGKPYACPIWQFTGDGGTTVRPCVDDHSALASCDHFGSVEYRDDPQTPTTGDTLETIKGFEGQPLACGLQRDAHGPMAGMFTVAHGSAQLRACLVNGQGCSDWKPFDH